MRTRKVGASVLVVLAAISLLIASVGWWADRYFLNSQRFSTQATNIVEEEAVQQALAVAITDQITKASGRDLSLAQPFITSIVREVVQTPAFQDLFDAAVLRLHRAVVDGGARDAVLNLSDAVDRVRNALEPVAPNLAEKIPEGEKVRVTILDQSQLQTVYDTTNIAKKGILAISVLTVLLFAGGIALSPRRWRTLALAGWVTLGLFAARLVAVGIGRGLVGSLADRAEYSSAAEAAYKVITRGLVVSGVVIAVVALLVALGAGWTDRHGGWPAVRTKLAGSASWVKAQVPTKQTAPELAMAGAGAVSTGVGSAQTADAPDAPEAPQAPETPAATAGAARHTATGVLATRLPEPAHKARTAHWWRAAALLVLGLFAVFSPDSLTTIVVVLLGLAALYLALTEGIAAWASPKEPSGAADDTPVTEEAAADTPATG